MLKKILLFYYFISIGLGVQAQNIGLYGNDIFIAGDGNNVPVNADGTLLAEAKVNSSSEQVFRLRNFDSRLVIIESIAFDDQEFYIEDAVRWITRNGSANFRVIFEPSSEGLKSTILRITARVRGVRRNYAYNIQALAEPGGVYEGLMISQYYENSDTDYIEIINNSDQAMSGRPYYLAVYKRWDDLNGAPRTRNVVEIAKLDAGEVLVFDDFRLRGNEVIVISTSKNNSCYQDRVDLIGQQGEVWGSGLSMSKGACASESAHRNFDKNNWIELGLDEVDTAIDKQNLYLGTYQSGTIVWDGTNWTGGALPDRTRAATIDGVYSGNTGNIKACDLVVNQALDFDNGSLTSVVLYGDLTINDSFNLGDKESLVMYDDDAIITGNITKREMSTNRNNTHDFTYWSAPIADAKLSEVFAGVSPGRIFYFDQSKTDTSDPDHPEFWWTWVYASGNMDAGKGYAAEGLTGTTGVHEISFTGIPNNGMIESAVHHHDDTNLDNDFNMIGNPYPCAIDIEAFFDMNSGIIDPTVYLWTHTTPVSESSGDFSFDDYATYNYTGGTGVGTGPTPTKNIGSAQGFFVRAIKTGSVTFSNSMRMEDSNDQFFKRINSKNESTSSEKDRIWLNLTTDQGGFNQLLIGFVEGASDKIDPGYDAIKFEGSNKIGFYSLVENEKMAIQGLGKFISDKELVLGFDTKVENRTYKISIEKLEGMLVEADIILIDQLTGAEHNLKDGPYSFDENEKGSYKERFKLGFLRKIEEQPEEIPEEIVKGLRVFSQGDRFNIASSKKVETIRIYDIMGRMILESHPNQSDFEVFEPTARKGQLLLMQIEHSDKSSQVKKVYKQ